MSGIYAIPDNAMVGLLISVILASIIFGVFWAIRSYTEYNNAHDCTRATNPYKLNYACGTVVAIGLAGVITFGVTAIAMYKIVGIEYAETWMYCIFSIIAAFIIAGLMVKAVHMGIETALKWLGQSAKDAAQSVKDLSSDLAEAKALVGDAMVQINALKTQNAELQAKLEQNGQQ